MIGTSFAKVASLAATAFVLSTAFASADILARGSNVETQQTTSAPAFIELNSAGDTTLTFKTTAKAPVAITFSGVCFFDYTAATANPVNLDIDIRVDGVPVTVHSDPANKNLFCSHPYPAGYASDYESMSSTTVVSKVLSKGTHSIRIRVKETADANTIDVNLQNTTVLVQN